MDVRIRDERAAEAMEIAALIQAAFLSAAHTAHTEHSIVKRLRDSGMLTISLVAELNEGLAGHVAVSPVSISDGSSGWFGLGPLSVLPAHQRGGIGTKLTERALGELRRVGATGCVVLGEPNYYGRFGFKADSNLTLPGVPPEYFQCLAFTSIRARGHVKYHPAFDLV